MSGGRSLGDRALLIRGNADRELLRMARGVDVGLDDDPVSVWGAAQLRPDHRRLLDEDVPPSVSTVVCGHRHRPLVRQRRYDAPPCPAWNSR
ncbi:hypothetical protein BSZ07_01060 [Streptomyces sp. M1013]|uniref:hypothetical protein n=1 Tax=Streptomyces sp. M1013 TaxID=549798 RepID=UPI000978EB9A|nr:hypothetical protein [Streptomyces sp. M1013]OMI91492.1 hypothetical protein BSZ07_01060 [Streptomyces sp. M1013]